MDWSTFLRIAHILGTALGVGGTTFLEIYTLKHINIKNVDIFENDAVKISISLIRYGLIILAFSGLGLLVLWRLNMRGPEVFFSARFLAKMVIILILLLAALATNLKFVNLKYASAVSTASWYAAMILGMWRRVPLSFFTIMIGYAFLIVFTYLILEYFRNRSLKIK